MRATVVLSSYCCCLASIATAQLLFLEPVRDREREREGESGRKREREREREREEEERERDGESERESAVQTPRPSGWGACPSSPAAAEEEKEEKKEKKQEEKKRKKRESKERACDGACSSSAFNSFGTTSGIWSTSRWTDPRRRLKWVLAKTLKWR